MNGAIAAGLRFAFALVAGFGGIFAGGFLGAVAGRFITGEQGLHGFDVITLACMGGGAIIGLLTGVKTGTVIGTKLTHACRKREESVSTPQNEGIDHEG